MNQRVVAGIFFVTVYPCLVAYAIVIVWPKVWRTIRGRR